MKRVFTVLKILFVVVVLVIIFQRRFVVVHEFLSEFGVYVSLGLTILSDIVLWFRSRIKKQDKIDNRQLKEQMNQLITLLRGEDKHE